MEAGRRHPTQRASAILRRSFLRVRGFVLKVVRAQRSFLFGQLDEGGIKLHERRVHGGVLLMARVAGRLLGHLFGWAVGLKSEESPPTSEARFIFNVDLTAHRVRSLVVATLVNRGIASRHANL